MKPHDIFVRTFEDSTGLEFPIDLNQPGVGGKVHWTISYFEKMVTFELELIGDGDDEYERFVWETNRLVVG